MSHPIFNPIKNIILPHNIEIPIIPIKIHNLTNKSVVLFHGLPQGLSYNDINHIINGKPRTVGHFGVTGSVQNELGFDIIQFTIIVIKCDVIPVSIKPISTQMVSLGTYINPIEVVVDSNDTDVIVNGLPHGLLYDPYTHAIEGFPEEVGDFKISVHAVNKQDTEMIRYFSLLVEGIISPSISVNTAITEILHDTANNFHQIDDQIIYSFIISNTGNVPIQNIIAHIDTWRDIHSDIKLMPNNCTVIKHTHKIMSNDLEIGLIKPICIISAEIFNKIKITIPSIITPINIKGHDVKNLHIERINYKTNHQRNTIHFIYLITNHTDTEVTNMTIKNQYNDEIILSNNLIKPHDSVYCSFTSQLQPIYYLMATGKCINSAIGNTYKDILYIKNKIVPKMVLNADKYNKTLTITFKNKHIVDNSPSGKIKFYDNSQLLGNAKIRKGVSIFKVPSWNIGRHIIYGSYGGDDKYESNGSNIIEMEI